VAISVKSSSSSEVLSPSGNDSGLIGGHDGTVGMADQVHIQVQGTGVASGGNWAGNSGNCSMGERSGSVGKVGSSVDSSTGGKVVGTSSGNGGLVSRDDRSVRVGDQVGVQVEGPSVAGGDHRSSNWGNSRDCWGHSNRGNMSSNSGQVISTGSSDCGLVNGNNGSIGVAHEGGVQVERAGVASGNNRCSMGNSRDSWGNGMGNPVGGGKSAKMIGTCCGNRWLVNRHNRSVWVTHQSVEAGGS